MNKNSLAYRIVSERDLAISYSRGTLIHNSLVIGLFD